MTTLCRASSDELRAAAAHAFGQQRPTTAAWRAFMMGTALPIITRQLDGIAALPHAPADDDSSIAAIVKAGREAVAAATQDSTLLMPGSSAPFDTYDRLATAYGIPACNLGT